MLVAAVVRWVGWRRRRRRRRVQASNARHRQRELPRSIFAFFIFLPTLIKIQNLKQKLFVQNYYVGTHMSV